MLVDPVIDVDSSSLRSCILIQLQARQWVRKTRLVGRLRKLWMICVCKTTSGEAVYIMLQVFRYQVAKQNGEYRKNHGKEGGDENFGFLARYSCYHQGHYRTEWFHPLP